MVLTFSFVQEDKPGEKWKALFDRTWPHYKHWFLSEGNMVRKGYLTSYSAIQHYMPEIIPLYEELITLSGGGDLEARFLSMYCPPAYMSACSQVAWARPHSTSLIRNYDYSFKMFEGTMWYSNWLQPVIGVSDCNWGLLDGMNASGLAASLTFGGRKVVGEGFGIPIVIRYILEVANDVNEAISILNRIPVHMAYNVTLVDATGNFATVYLSPDRQAVIVNSAVATNHQVEVEWYDYASLTGTLERKKLLEELILREHETENSMIKHFLHPPLYNTNFEKYFGTLYTILYRVNEGEVEIYWPKVSAKQTFQGFQEGRIVPFTPSFRQGLEF
jgi:predicted choloylglycine hydrolase